MKLLTPLNHSVRSIGLLGLHNLQRYTETHTVKHKATCLRRWSRFHRLLTLPEVSAKVPRQVHFHLSSQECALPFRVTDEGLNYGCFYFRLAGFDEKCASKLCLVCLETHLLHITTHATAAKEDWR